MGPGNPIHRRDLIPFRLVAGSLPTRLYSLAQGRSRSLARRGLRKAAMRAYAWLQRSGRTFRAVAEVCESGKRFDFNPLNAQFHAIYLYPGGYEIDVMAAIRALLPRDGVLVDAGANWGYFALALAADPSFAGKAIAFEPSRSSFADLESVRTQLAIGMERLEAHRVALSDHAGSALLGSTDPIHSGLAQVNEDRGEPIELKSLDAYELPRVDAVKIDVEGHELAVLNGARKTLARHRPAIIIENWFRPATAEADLAPLLLLCQLGYQLYMPGVADASRAVTLLTDLDGYAGEEFAFLLLPFSPAQRGFFGKRQNIVAMSRNA